MPSDPQARISKALSAASKSTYEGGCTLFISWLLDNKPDLLPENFKTKLNQQTDKRKFIKSTIFDDKDTPPLIFSKVTSDDVTDWLSMVKKSNGEWFTQSAYSNHRSSITHLYSNYGVKIPSDFDHKMQQFMNQVPKQNYTKGAGTPKKKSETKKRIWQDDDMSIPVNSPIPLLKKRAKEDCGSSWEAKAMQRVAARSALAELRLCLGEEKYLLVGDYLTDYHKSLSTSKYIDESEEAIKTYKSKLSSLLEGNESLYSKIISFLPEKYRHA